jgi:uncharacterized protein (TIGR02145 family)
MNGFKSIIVGVMFLLVLPLVLADDKNPLVTQPTNVAVNPGKSHRTDETFATEDSSAVLTDIEGNVYRAITIGTQVWMAENLKVTHYRNGDKIYNEPDASMWAHTAMAVYCNYDNDSANVVIYGRLYNWYVVDDKRNIAPEGWHVPSVDEWKTLFDYLGGAKIAGGKMKTPGTTHWCTPNHNATNESGFSALPGGVREDNGKYGQLGYSAYFWSSTELHQGYVGTNCGEFITLNCGITQAACCIDAYHHKNSGMSIRCVKD